MSRKRFIPERDCPGAGRGHPGTRGFAGVPFLFCSYCRWAPGAKGSKYSQEKQP